MPAKQRPKKKAKIDRCGGSGLDNRRLRRELSYLSTIFWSHVRQCLRKRDASHSSDEATAGDTIKRGDLLGVRTHGRDRTLLWADDFNLAIQTDDAKKFCKNVAQFRQYKWAIVGQ